MKEKNEKKISLDAVTMEDFYESNGIYVDKTKQIIELLTSTKGSIFTRPRRMGKTLLVSTIEAMYSGEKKYFEGTYAYENWDWNITYPIIRLDMSTVDTDSKKNLEETLNKQLLNTYRSMNIATNLSIFKSSYVFSTLIDEINDKYNKPVVILIDEYDYQFNEFSSFGIKNDRIRKYLSDFYRIIKSYAPLKKIKYAFLTGITNLKQTSIFTSLNNLKDISFKEEYADIVGFTENEIKEYFPHYIKAFAEEKEEESELIIEKLRFMYNGYRFSKNKTKVYTPWSILNSLGDKEFYNYWYYSGTPSFLREYYKKSYDDGNAKSVHHLLYYVDNKVSKIPCVEKDSKVDFSAVLYAAGYATIKDYNKKTGEYLLGLPNKEVEGSLLKNFLFEFTKLGPGEKDKLELISKAFESHNIDLLKDELNKIYNTIPFYLFYDDEKTYHGFTHAIFATVYGAEKIQSEKVGHIGRLDTAIYAKKNDVYIIEYKMIKRDISLKKSKKNKKDIERKIEEDIEFKAQEAIQQIREQEYYAPFVIDKKVNNIYLVGMVFDNTKRSLREVIIEPLGDTKKRYIPDKR